MNRLLLFFLVIATTAFTGCVSMTSFPGATTQPEKPLPENVKSLAVVNRTKPTLTVEVVAKNIADRVIIRGDRPGIEQCLGALCDQMRTSNYYKVNSLADRLSSYQSASFPPPMAKEHIIGIGKQFGADALIVLEIFDDQTNLSFVPGVQMQMDAAGNDYPLNIVTANQNTHLTVGWRVYNTKDGAIIEEYKAERDFQWSANGINEQNAREKLLVPPGALEAAGAEIGNAYAARISPVTATIARYYYGKTNSQFKLAKQCVKNKNWERAKKIWESQMNDKNPKIAGKAAYNLAVYYERSGNLDKALEMARKANSLSKDGYARNLLYAHGQPY